MQITLTQGLVALVDDGDFKQVSRYKWYAFRCARNFYAARKVGGQTFFMHKELLKPQGSEQCDHKDHNGLNNCRDNLRLVSPAENSKNRRLNVNSTSGYKGVSPHRGGWVVYIQADGRKIFGGSFSCKEKAAKVYDQLALKYHGEFANLNFPLEIGG